MFGLAIVAGIGFTVALYITVLSFDDPDLMASGKLGVLCGSLLAGTLGYLVLRAVPGTTAPPSDDG